MEINSAKSNYEKNVIPAMREKFGYGNSLAVPRIEKVVINAGVGKINKESEKIDEVLNALGNIAGQRPMKTKAKKAVSGFKIRKGLEIGIKVTLRGKRMWSFIDRLINVALPRSRDFQGIEQKSVDEKGNLNMGIKEHIIFSEIEVEKVKNIFSFQITVVTTAKNKKEGIELLRLMRFPLK